MTIIRRGLAQYAGRTSAFSPPPRETWTVGALCAQTDPELWFPDEGESNQEAKTVCRRCPVRTECLAYALDHKERFGVWGGTSAEQRRTAKQRRRLRGAA